MSEGLSQIADALVATPSEPLGSPTFTRAVKAWVVAVDEEGSVLAWEIPQPEGIKVESNREEREPELNRPWELRNRLFPGDFGPMKLRITVDSFDGDKHPRSERPNPLYTLYWRPPRAWKP